MLGKFMACLLQLEVGRPECKFAALGMGSERQEDLSGAGKPGKVYVGFEIQRRAGYIWSYFE